MIVIKDVCENPRRRGTLAAGGFVLNGVGEMAGLTQVLEAGWLETPILLTNSHSVGRVHAGVVNFMTRKYPRLGTETDVILPVVGEADDSFLNDVRVGICSAQDELPLGRYATPAGPTRDSSPPMPSLLLLPG